MPMWRNGRRNGLKIRFREKRSMGSNPIIGTSKIAILLGNSLKFEILLIANSSRTKRHENTVYSSSIGQVILLTLLNTLFTTTEAELTETAPIRRTASN